MIKTCQLIFWGLGLFLTILIYGLSQKNHITGIDFSVFYAASSLIQSGHADRVYDIASLRNIIVGIYGENIPTELVYFYPPYTLPLFYPLAVLPYSYSFILWHLFQVSFFLLISHKLLHSKIIWRLLGYSGLFLNIYWGQNAVLIGALFLGFIHYLDRKPVISGICLALLSFKPQFSLYCFIAVLAIRNWTCLKAALSTFLILSGIELISFGSTLWSDYLKVLKLIPEMHFFSGWINTSAISPTVYSAFRILGAPPSLAFGFQYAVSFLAALLVYWAWRQRGEKLLTASILVLCVMLGLPYYLQYDTFLLCIPILFADNFFIKNIWTMLLSGILWILPAAGWLFTAASHLQIAPLIYLTALFMLIRALHQPHTKIHRKPCLQQGS